MRMLNLRKARWLSKPHSLWVEWLSFELRSVSTWSLFLYRSDCHSDSLSVPLPGTHHLFCTHKNRACTSVVSPSSCLSPNLFYWNMQVKPMALVMGLCFLVYRLSSIHCIYSANCWEMDWTEIMDLCTAVVKSYHGQIQLFAGFLRSQL